MKWHQCIQYFALTEVWFHCKTLRTRADRCIHGMPNWSQLTVLCAQFTLVCINLKDWKLTQIIKAPDIWLMPLNWHSNINTVENYECLIQDSCVQWQPYPQSLERLVPKLKPVTHLLGWRVLAITPRLSDHYILAWRL